MKKYLKVEKIIENYLNNKNIDVESLLYELDIDLYELSKIIVNHFENNLRYIKFKPDPLTNDLVCKQCKKINGVFIDKKTSELLEYNDIINNDLIINDF